MKTKPFFISLVFGIVGLLLFLWGTHPSSVKEIDKHIQRFEFLSQPYHIDRKYKSMKGPSGKESIVLQKDVKAPELLWIVSYRSRMVGEDGSTPMPEEFMCHSNLDFNLESRNVAFGRTTNEIRRISTLSQGLFSVRFPPGFGIPVMSYELLDIETQVLNLNLPNPNVTVRHKVTIEYIRDRDLKRPLKSLLTVGAQGLVLVEGNNPFYDLSPDESQEHGPGCLIGETAHPTQARYTDRFGNRFTGHWVVKPGREVNTTLATKFMNIPFDTTVHHIAVHLHPLAESLELRDRTTGKTVFKSYAENFKKGLGLSRVDTFSSRKGLPIYKNHEYEIISVYNNTASEDQDAMAVMVLFLFDKSFKKP